MGLTLQVPPGYSDLSDTILAANSPALGIDIAKIYDNSAFGKVRCEVFYNTAFLKNGEAVPLPVSPIDGYAYSRDELNYMWAVNSGNGSWISGADSLFYGQWLIDQATGDVFCDEWYRRSGHHANVVHTNDGLLHVWTIAQRQRSNIVMASSPSYSAITAGWIGLDKPLTQQLAQGLNDDAKFSVVNEEVIFLGEFYNGQTVPHPVSPADGYTYSYAECKFLFSWRWTPQGNSAALAAPPISYGQLGPMQASVSSVGVVSTTVKYIDDNGNVNSTNDGRLAVFAFCTRSGTPSGLTLQPFTELDFDLFMPGSPLEYPTVQSISDDILNAIGTPEFFGPTTYKDGDTIPAPTSVIDPSYTYTRAELQYLWGWSDTTPASGSNVRVVYFYGHVDNLTGAVTLRCWRLPPGGPYVDDDNSHLRISVIVVARRQGFTAPASNTTTTTPQADSGVGGNQVVDVPFLNITMLAIGPTTRGNFTVAHGLSAAPSDVDIKMQSDGLIRFQPGTMWDATNVYLNASDDGLIATLVFESGN